MQPWREYLFTADGLREALKGFDFNQALDVLRDANMLKPNKDGTPSRVVSVDGQSKRLFAITSV